MSDETTLLSCPICGNVELEPRTNRWINCLGDASYSAKIECENCNLVIETKSIGYKTEEEAINAIASTWSARTVHGTLTADDVRDLIERHSAWVIGNNRCFRDGAYEAIADELNAGRW